MALRSDGKRVVVTGGDAANIGRKARYRSGLVGVGGQPHWESVEAQRTLRAVAEAHDGGPDGHPSEARPDQRARSGCAISVEESQHYAILVVCE